MSKDTFDPPLNAMNPNIRIRAPKATNGIEWPVIGLST